MEQTRPSRQVSKSVLTRTAVLNATLDCLAQLPYPAVTIAVVAERAGISKGGIQYHFRSRDQLLQEAVNHLFERRLDAYRRDLAEVPKGVSTTDHVVDTHWKHLTEPDFQTYQELVFASRSNPELRKLLIKRYREFFRDWRNVSQSSFDWNAVDPEVTKLGNAAHYLMDGMAYGWFADQLREKDIQALLDFAKSLLRQGVALSGKSSRKKSKG